MFKKLNDLFGLFAVCYIYVFCCFFTESSIKGYFVTLCDGRATKMFQGCVALDGGQIRRKLMGIECQRCMFYSDVSGSAILFL